MKLLDKRTTNRMSEEELKKYQEELSKELPDLTENCESVDIALLLSQLPLRGKHEALQDEDSPNPPQEPQEAEG